MNETDNKDASGSSERIMDMLDLFYANKHLYEKIKSCRKNASKTDHNL